jgi:hypothetical protein
LVISFGAPRPATLVPLNAATLHGERATLYTVGGEVAHRVDVGVVGESGGTLFVDEKLPAGARVVLEGRALLDEGDRVAAKER